jgi:hypothetical protein
MVDFIFAGILYLGVMFVVFFSLSFVTIGITYVIAAFARRCIARLRQPNLALK